MVFPIRAHLDLFKRLMIGDHFLGRGSRQRGIAKSVFCNTHKVSVVGRNRAIQLFESDLSEDRNLLERLWTLSGLRLVCHCTPNQACHGDVLIRKFSELYPGAFDRLITTVSPAAEVLDQFAALREEPPSDPGSSADEGALLAGAGWTGSGNPMSVATGYTAALTAMASLWPPSQRRYPTHLEWTFVSSLTETQGSPGHLMRLALGKVDSSPFADKEISELKADIITFLKDKGPHIKISSKNCRDVLLDCRFLELLLSVARDPEVALGSSLKGASRARGPSPSPPGALQGQERDGVKPVVALGRSTHW